MGNNVGSNYPVIDRFDYDKGIATSIKSRDLRAKIYQNGKTLERTIKKDIDKLYEFKGYSWGKIDISHKEIQARVLDMVVPNVKLSESQIEAINRAIVYAREKGISINIIVGGK